MTRRYPRALIVEDDTTIQHLMLRLLESWRWEAVGVGTIAAAAESLAGSPFDLVLLDLKLPDGEGSEVLAAARRLPVPPTVVVITARPPGQIEADIFAGVDLVLAKPFVFDTLHSFVNGVADAFHRRGTPGSPA